MTPTALSFALLLAAAPLAGRAGPPDDRQAIAAIEQRWLDHIADPAVLQDILAEDFVHPVQEGDFIGKAEQIAWAKAHPSAPDRIARFERLDVRLYGNTAVATGVTVASQPGWPTARRILFTDVFVRRDGRWQAVNAQETVAP
jgi:hypothetical protein